MIVDFRRQHVDQHSSIIHNAEVEQVSSYKFLGVHISEDLSWTLHTDTVVKKARQNNFLMKLRKFGMNTSILTNFYRAKKALQRVVRAGEDITGSSLPSIQDIYRSRSLRKAHSIIKDPTHPAQGLFCLLPSGRRYRSLPARTKRFKDSCFPQAVRLLNS
ncbi:hypothetical protein WMY93_012007 [Mugilogobius chulae]|uniref:Alkylated DNA repair protein AlkB homologue 8 N-terminal domain-containing protein n=1 Tax=Mugilogobius chulae TaxID=88201 RepID=A0AAW0PFK0_9GOBI